jgi:hypothetical protein
VSVDADAAAPGGHEAHQQPDQGGLAGARLPDQGQRAPGRNREVDVADDPGTARVGEADALEAHLAGHGVQRRAPRGLLGVDGKQAGDARQAGCGLHVERLQRGEHRERRQGHAQVYAYPAGAAQLESACTTDGGVGFISLVLGDRADGTCRRGT